MTYRIARNGQIFGPYTLAEVERYLASGNIVVTDLAQSEGAADWMPVAQLFPTAPAATPTAAVGEHLPRGAAAGYIPTSGSDTRPFRNPAQPFAGSAQPFPQAVPLFPDPPDLPWWLALILGIVTGGVFFVVWDVVQAAWMRRVAPRSTSIFLYSAAAVLFLVNLPASWHSVGYWVFHVPFVPTHHSGLLGLVRFGLWLAARFVLRSELLEHFNTSEPLGLRLSGFLTFLLGGLYFQFHFNQINAIKRSLRVSVPGF